MNTRPPNRTFDVFIRRKTLGAIEKLPLNVQNKVKLLVDDLKEKGPYLAHWKNFRKLGPNRYHCHWVACWLWFDNQLIIEVYHVGSRENAPY